MESDLIEFRFNLQKFSQHQNGKSGEGGRKEKQKSGCPCGHSQLYAGSLFVFLFFICVFLVLVCVFASFSKHGAVM